MSARNILLAAGGSADDKLYVDDVFSAYLRVGTGADAIVTTGIDMTKGYMLWTKGRNSGMDHALYHSARGVTLDIVSNSTGAQTTQSTGIKSVSVTGHTVGALAKMNTNSATYVDWVFRNADKFYGHSVVTKSAGSNATVSFANLGTLGMVRVKRTDSAGSWYIWHRSLSAGQLLIGETTTAAATRGHITVSGTTVTLVNGVIEDGDYLVEAFAQDTSTDGIIQCGSYNGNGAISGPIITLGWEPQFLVIKRVGATGGWYILDVMRGITSGNSSAADPSLTADASDNEDTLQCYVDLTPTGFSIHTNGAATNANGSTYIYLAIRRPNKPPTTGTEVYNAIARTGTGAAPVDIAAGFSPDLVSIFCRGGGQYCTWVDKLRGVSPQLFTADPYAEVVWHSGVTQFLPTGVSIYDVLGAADMNQLGYEYINHFFKRAPGFFDVVCYKSSGSVMPVTHSLVMTPELMIIKDRAAANEWAVYHKDVGNTKYLTLNTTTTPATLSSAWNNTSPTNTVFTVGTADITGSTGLHDYVAYLFATLPGISKVGSYTGNGSSQTINCGFTTGARFILIKRTDGAGDWYIWDTARGIVAANDPHLSLNTPDVEVTTNDSVDPDASGFVVNQVAATNINVSGGQYIFLAIA